MGHEKVGCVTLNTSGSEGLHVRSAGTGICSGRSMEVPGHVQKQEAPAFLMNFW